MTSHPPHSLLKDEQLEKLRAYLEARAVPNDGMSLEMLDGYLHAVVIGPETILPTEWFPRIWGHKPGHEYQWDKELTEVFGLVAQHQNSIAAALRVGEGEWAPLIDVFEVDGRRLSYGQEWALGFMRGVELRLARWDPLGKDPAHSPGWRAIGALALGRNHPASAKRARTQAQRDRLIEKMLDFVEHAAAYWLERYDPWQPVRRPAQKVGRNDPCPCGSGRKHKQCCGRSGDSALGSPDLTARLGAGALIESRPRPL